MTTGEPSTSADLEVVDSLTEVVTDNSLRPLVAAWLLGFPSENTDRNYRNDLGDRRAFCAERDLDPLLARRAHVDAWARLLEASGLKERSVARRLSAVSSWYQYLVQEGALSTSPTQHVRRPKVSDEGETPGLTRDELRRLLAAARQFGSLRSVALLSLLAHTGVQIGEALSRDIEHLAYDRGHRILRLERKGARGGRTVLTAPVVRALKEYLDGRTTGPLFITKSGRRLDQPEAWRMVRRLARRASLDGAAESDRTHCASRSSPVRGKPVYRSKTCRTQPAMPTLVQPGGATVADTRWTDTRPMP